MSKSHFASSYLYQSILHRLAGEPASAAQIARDIFGAAEGSEARRQCIAVGNMLHRLMSDDLAQEASRNSTGRGRPRSYALTEKGAEEARRLGQMRSYGLCGPTLSPLP